MIPDFEKKLETSVSNNIIDEMYELAIQAGALGEVIRRRRGWLCYFMFLKMSR